MRAPELAVEGLRVTGEGGREILNVPDLTASPGEAVVVRGPSGAGKSTLLFAIAGLARPAAGRICWGGTDIAALSDRARAAFRRQTFGIVFQDHLLFEELSALANAGIAALYAPRRARAAIRAKAAAELSALGLNGHAGRRTESYSGGERQRIAVARALAADPAVLLADEPTASLDRDTADALAEALFALSRCADRTLIAVSHDPSFHARADRVIEIVDGRLAGSAADA